MPLTAKIDEFGRTGWIVLMILGFIIWWPLGLIALAYILGSGRMSCSHYSADRWQHKMEKMQAKVDRMRDRFAGSFSGNARYGFSPSGNRAFDEYRTETIKRLEEEQQEFKDFLERLRFAKDKTEFDAFMNERRNKPAPTNDAPKPE